MIYLMYCLMVICVFWAVGYAYKCGRAEGENTVLKQNTGELREIIDSLLQGDDDDDGDVEEFPQTDPFGSHRWN